MNHRRNPGSPNSGGVAPQLLLGAAFFFAAFLVLARLAVIGFLTAVALRVVVAAFFLAVLSLRLVAVFDLAALFCVLAAFFVAFPTLAALRGAVAAASLLTAAFFLVVLLVVATLRVVLRVVAAAFFLTVFFALAAFRFMTFLALAARLAMDLRAGRSRFSSRPTVSDLPRAVVASLIPCWVRAPTATVATSTLPTASPTNSAAWSSLSATEGSLAARLLQVTTSV